MLTGGGGGNWQKVWFFDESKFDLFGSDRRHYCRRKDGEDLCPQKIAPVVKHGGGCVVVWMVVTWDGRMLATNC